MTFSVQALRFFFLIIGFDTESLLPPVWVGGESEALARLERHLERKAWVASFGRPKMTPQSLLPSQTGLSPYLRFGCLSTRLFYYQLTDLYKKVRDVLPQAKLFMKMMMRDVSIAHKIYRENFSQVSILFFFSFSLGNFAVIIK